jgi:hypothetical protein
MKIRWATFGLVAAMSLGCANMGHHHNGEEEEEGQETKVTLDQCPPPVKATMMQAAEGNQIKSVDKEMKKDGKVVYETDVMIGGKNMEIRVAPDGKLLSKKEDREEDEHPAKKEKEEKE